MLIGEEKNSLPKQYFYELNKLLDSLDARPKPTHSPRGLAHRGTLGDFTSIVCFKALFAGLEDLLGAEASGVVFIRAGRLRGQNLVEDWGVGHLQIPLEKLGHLLDAAFGHDGTRLCVIHGVKQSGENIVVSLPDTICSVGAPEQSVRRCTFTLGAVWGALEALTGKKFLAQQTGSVLAGEEYDQFTFTPL